MADLTETAGMEISLIPEDDENDPEKSEASPISDDYDPSVPTTEKDSAVEITPSKMKVAELRLQLTNRGLDAKGNKAALVERLEEALESSGDQETPAEGTEAANTGENGEENAEADDDNDDGESGATENIDNIESILDLPMDVDDTAVTEQEATDSAETKDEPAQEGAATETESEKPSSTEGKIVPKAKPAAKEEVKKEPAAVVKTPANAQKSTEDNASTKDTAKSPATTPKDEKATKAKSKEEVKVEKGPPAELEKYWKAVKDKPTDFTGWTYLLQYVEQQEHMPSVRDAFDAFLARYPYCYGYWKKYADMERKKAKCVPKATEVFETGLKSIPLSADLWMQYIQFIGQTTLAEGATDKLRGVYEKAIAAAGTDFRSDKLWDMYINFEKDKKEWQRVTKIYDQLLTIPTQLYSHHFEKFKEHVKKHHPKDILSVDEFIKLRMEVVDALGLAEPVIDEDGGDDAPPGVDDAPPGVEIAPPGMETASAKRTAGFKHIEAENEAIRKKILEIRTAIYRQTEQEVSKRWAYEEGIRRPYFHAKPLEKSQLKNWREYLDFETTNGTHERVLILYERCLVACALYEEFWIRYAKYLEPHSVDGVSSVYKRACSIHLPKKPSIHLRWAAFEEKQGNKSAAQEILVKLEENVPDLIMVTLERISLERRLGNTQDVVRILKERIEAHKKPEIKVFFAIKLSRYYMKILRDVSSARNALYEALEYGKNKVTLYLQLIDLEIQQTPINESIILDLFQKGITASFDVDNKMKFSQRRLTYLIDFGTDVAKLQTAYESHQVLLKEQLEILNAANKKRNLETSSTSTPAVQPAKKTKVEDSTPATTSSTPAKSATSKTLLSNPSPSQNQTSNPPQQTNQDYNQAGQGGAWGGYNQSQYGQHGMNYGPQQPGPGGYNQPPPPNMPNYNQQYQQYQQAWGNYNQGYYPR